MTPLAVCACRSADAHRSGRSRMSLVIFIAGFVTAAARPVRVHADAGRPQPQRHLEGTCYPDVCELPCRPIAHRSDRFPPIITGATPKAAHERSYSWRTVLNELQRLFIETPAAPALAAGRISSTSFSRPPLVRMPSNLRRAEAGGSDTAAVQSLDATAGPRETGLLAAPSLTRSHSPSPLASTGESVDDGGDDDNEGGSANDDDVGDDDDRVALAATGTSGALAGPVALSSHPDDGVSDFSPALDHVLPETPNAAVLGGTAAVGRVPVAESAPNPSFIGRSYIDRVHSDAAIRVHRRRRSEKSGNSFSDIGPAASPPLAAQPSDSTELSAPPTATARLSLSRSSSGLVGGLSLIELAPLSALLSPGGPAWSQLDASAQLSEASLAPLLELTAAVKPSLPQAVVVEPSETEDVKEMTTQRTPPAGPSDDANPVALRDDETSMVVVAGTGGLLAPAERRARTSSMILAQAISLETEAAAANAGGGGYDDVGGPLAEMEGAANVTVAAGPSGDVAIDHTTVVVGSSTVAVQAVAAASRPSSSSDLLRRDNEARQLPPGASLKDRGSFMRTISGFLLAESETAMPSLAQVAYGAVEFPHACSETAFANNPWTVWLLWRDVVAAIRRSISFPTHWSLCPSRGRAR